MKFILTHSLAAIVLLTAAISAKVSPKLGAPCKADRDCQSPQLTCQGIEQGLSGFCAPATFGQECMTEKDCDCGLKCINSFHPFGTKACGIEKCSRNEHCPGNTNCVNSKCVPESCKSKQDCKIMKPFGDNIVECANSRCESVFNDMKGMSEWAESYYKEAEPAQAGMKLMIAGGTFKSTGKTAFRFEGKAVEEYQVFTSEKQGFQEIAVSERKTGIYLKQWTSAYGDAKYCRKFPRANTTNCLLFSTKGMYRLTNKWVISVLQTPKSC
jgi:hypothetical protein